MAKRCASYNGLTSSERRLYDIWHTMIRRCEDPRCKDYENYGARGVSVCERWHDFRVFAKWAKRAGYRCNLTLDRMDSSAGYSPANCRWTTMAEQSRNRRSNVRITIAGESKVVKDWANAIGVSCYTVYSWVARRGIDYARNRIERSLELMEGSKNGCNMEQTNAPAATI